MTKKWSADFDSFFEEMTKSLNYSNLKKTNTKELEKELRKMDEKILKAWDIMWSFNNTFATEEAKKIWNNLTSWTKVEEKKDKEENKLDIEYFEDKNNSPTFWFKWIAWMDNLKQNLEESFIKPLKFKFLVQKFEKEWARDWKNKEKHELYLELYEVYKKFKVSIPTWMLFYWPPWTGKTFITKKLAEQLWAWLIKKSVWEFGSSYIHATSKNIREFFAQAKKASENWPLILFLDEIDSLVSKRTNNVDSNKAEEVSQFLQEFNALEDAPNLIVIAATNRPDHLDSAIMRSWRLDKKIYIWPPDFEARKELFQIYIEKKKRPSEKLDYDELARLTDWYVAADIENICDEVSRDASQNILDLANTLEWNNIDYDKIKSWLSNHKITMDLLKQAIKETTSSLKYVDMSVFENWEKNMEG